MAAKAPTVPHWTGSAPKPALDPIGSRHLHPADFLLSSPSFLFHGRSQFFDRELEKKKSVCSNKEQVTSHHSAMGQAPCLVAVPSCSRALPKWREGDGLPLSGLCLSLESSKQLLENKTSVLRRLGRVSWKQTAWVWVDGAVQLLSDELRMDA